MIVSIVEKSSTHSIFIPSYISINIEEDESFLKYTNDEVQGSKKKQKK